MPTPMQDSNGTRVVLDEENPWPGLASYGENLHRFFFGRTPETKELANLVDRGLLILLYGRSGLGKSSLINAGLREELRKRRRTYLPIPVSLRFAMAETAEKWSDKGLVQRVKDEISLVLKQEHVDARDPLPEETLYEYFHRRDIDFWDQQNHLLTPVLLFDQFEEIFTLGRADDSKHRQTEYFLQELCALAEGVHTDPVRERFAANPDLQTECDFEKSGFKILLCIREDYLPHLTERDDVLPSVLRNSMRLEEMDEDPAREAVGRPGAQILATGAVNRIIDFVATAKSGKRKVDPSILSLVCQQLNEERKKRQEQSGTRELIEPQHLTEERAVKIIEDYYRDSLQKFPRFRELIESKLVTQDGFRAVLPEAEILKSAEVGPPELDWLIGTRRILVRENLDGNTPWLRLSHDRLAAAARQGRVETELKRQKEQAEERERTARRNLKRAQLGLAVVIVLLACAVGALLYANIEAAEAKAQRDIAEKNRTIAYLFEVAGSYDSWRSGETDKARGLLEEGMPKSNDPGTRDVRGWEWYLMEGLCDLRETGSFQVLKGHTNAVNCVVSVPGQPHPMLVSAGADATLRLWDGTTGQEIKELISHHELVGLGFTFERRKSDQAIIVNRVFGGGPAARTNKLQRSDLIVKVGVEDGPLKEVSALTLEQLDDQLDPGSPGKRVRIEIEHPATLQHETVELVSEKFIAQVKHDSEVTKVAVSPDGAHLASADVDGQILLWDLSTGEIVGGVYTGSAVLGLAFSPNKPWLVTALRNEKNVVFCNCNAWSLQLPKGMPPLDQEVTTFAFAPDSSVAVATEDNRIHLWDIEKQVELRQISFGTDLKPGSLKQLAFSPDGSTLAASSGNELKLFDMKQPSQPVRSLQGVSYHLQFAFDPSSRYLATAGTDGIVQVWEVPTGKVVRTLKAHAGEFRTVAFLSGKITLASGADDGSVRLWNLQRTPPEKYHSIDTHLPAPTGVCFSFDGRYVACCDPWDKHVTILDGIEGRVLWTIPGSVWHTEFLPSRPILAVPNEANAIQFIDVTTGAQATGFPMLKGHNAPIRGIAFDADGKKMVSGDEDGHAFVWNTANGNAIPLPDQKESIRSVAFSPDGKWVATSTPADGRIDVWDPNTAGLVHEFKLSTVGFRLWFSPDSAFLLADEQNGRLDLINLKTGNSDKTLVGHNGPVFDMGFSPDRQRVISVGGDGTVRVWDARSGTEILLLDDDKAYTGAAFSPDGMRLATLAGSRLRLWDAALLSADNHKEDWMFYGERGRYYELGEDWALAIADYKQAMQLRAEDPMIRAHLAYCYGAVNDFENAGSESRAVSDSSSTEAKIAAGELSESVLLAAPNFDAKKYNEVAEQVTHLAQNDYDPSNANIAAWICSLVPGTTGKPEDLVDLMRRATNDQPKEYAYQSTLGSILYRAGHYEEAIKTLKSAMSMRPVPSENAPNSVPDQNNSQHDRDGSAFDWIFLAMANERLGQSTEAKKWSKQVADQLDRLKQDPLFDDPNWSWDWEQILQLKTLYAEARSLIEKVSGPG